MPIYGLSISSNAIPTDVYNSLSDSERSAVFAGFRQNVESNVLNPTFGSGNWQTGQTSVLFPKATDDGQTRLVFESEINSQVFVPPNQLPPALTLFDAPSNVTAGPDIAGAGPGASQVNSEPVAAPAPLPPGEVTTPAAGNENVNATASATDVEPNEDPFEASRLEAEQRLLNQEANPVTVPNAVDGGPGTGYGEGTGTGTGTGEGTGTGPVNNGTGSDPDPAATATQAGNQLIRQQPNRQKITTQTQQGDWRVRLSLAPGSNYLYNDPEIQTSATNGILLPLLWTNGVIFPYTPEISSAYRADYDSYNLTHSNYRGYFYKSSYVDSLNITANFTAQDNNEADYLLAVIHFFKSATKMFYGKDSQAGAPPPVVFLNGLGTFQYNNHPCVISQFNYTLPSDVDYIRTGNSRFTGQNLLTQRPRQNVATNPLSGAVTRLKNAFGFVPQGGVAPRPSPLAASAANTTYVPTKISIQLSLLPLQNRKQVSQQFSVKDYASGSLLRKGYW